jgi:lysophospholipase L1-like esterase
MKIRKKLASVIVTGALLASLPFNTFAKELDKEHFDYVALGDSLAAGKTPYGTNHDKGFVDYLVDRFEQSQYNVEVDKYGVSGYTTTRILNELYNPTNGKYVELQKSIKESELVTIDIGANDLLAQLPVIQQDPTQAPAALQSIGENLFLILKKIDELNPNTKVYVMGYYNPFPYYSEEQQAQLLPLLDALNKTIETVANQNGDIFIPTEKVIKKHEKEYIPNPEDIHLSLEGYQTIAKEFWKGIMKNK